MRLRSPAEYYIKSLIVHTDNYTDDHIFGILEDRGLEPVNVKYIKGLRSRLIKPYPFRPYDRHPKHIPSYQFMVNEGIWDMYEQDTYMKKALHLLGMPRAKEFIETTLLGHTPSVTIASKVSKDFRMACEPAVIDKFKKFFWNLDLLDSTMIRIILGYRSELNSPETDADGNKPSREEIAQHKAYKRASYLDPRRLAADLPYSPLSSLMAQMRLGVMPSKKGLSTILEVAEMASAMRVAEAALLGSERDSHMAMSFSIAAKNMADMLENAIKPDETLREGLNRIALKTSTLPVPTIHQLSDGNHTVELMPKVENTDDGSAPTDPGADEAVDGEFEEAEDDSFGVPPSER